MYAEKREEGSTPDENDPIQKVHEENAKDFEKIAEYCEGFGKGVLSEEDKAAINDFTDSISSGQLKICTSKVT